MSARDSGDPLPARAIGRIRTPFSDGVGTPIQPAFSQGAAGQVILDPAYADGLDDLDGFERAWLLFWMDRAKPFRPRVVPYRDCRERGLFATRSPSRPNPIGLSVVRIVRREGNVLHVRDVDMLDNTPLVDIKPYVPEFDAHPGSRAGWLDLVAVDRRFADDRFHAVDAAPRDAAAPVLAAGGDVVLHLGDVCIQKAARRAYDALVSSEAEDRSTVRAVDLLVRFLQTTDFAALRVAHPVLAGGTACRVRLFRREDGQVGWEISA